MLFVPVKQAWEDLHELVQRDKQAGKKKKKSGALSLSEDDGDDGEQWAVLMPILGGFGLGLGFYRCIDIVGVKICGPSLLSVILI